MMVMQWWWDSHLHKPQKPKFPQYNPSDWEKYRKNFERAYYSGDLRALDKAYERWRFELEWVRRKHVSAFITPPSNGDNRRSKEWIDAVSEVCNLWFERRQALVKRLRKTEDLF